MDDESKWTDVDDMLVHVAGLTEVHPTYTAIRFMNALSQLPASRDYLASKVTPESLSFWGDFSDAANFMDSLTEPGIISITKAFLDAIDVAWVVIVENVGAGGWHDGLPSDESIAAYFTMVRRPSLGGWRVHHLGDEIDLSLVPREPVPSEDGAPAAQRTIGRRFRDRLRFRRS